MLTKDVGKVTKYTTKGVYRQEEFSYSFDTNAEDSMRYQVILRLEMPEYSFNSPAVRKLAGELYLKWGIYEEFLDKFDVNRDDDYREEVVKYLERNKLKIFALLETRFEDALTDWRAAQKFFKGEGNQGLIEL